MLESCGIIFLLKSWSQNVNQRVIKTPKIYFFDTGLCAYLTGWKSAQALSEGIMNGAILENYVISEIIKSYIHNGKEPPVYFYRDKDMNEIDLIIEQDGLLYPVEIKRTANPDLSMTKSFRQIPEEKHGLGAVVSLYKTHIPLSREVVNVPVHEI